MIINFFLVGVLVGYGVGDSSEIVAPKNTATVSGQRLVLRCSATGNESFIREWKVARLSDQSTQNSDSRLIFSHWNNDEQYTISTYFPYFGAQVDEFGSAVLYTNSSRMEYAGLYTCVVEVKKDVLRYNAHVVILQHTPNCTFQRNEDRIRMTCTVAYRGNMAPVLQWRRHHQGDTETAGKVVTEGIQANTIAGSTIGSTLTIVVNPSNDDFYFSCTIFFLSSDSSNSNDNATKCADNAPEFRYTWNSPVVKGQSPTDDGLTVFGVGRNSAGVTEASESKNWFVISLALGAGMLVVFVLMTTITTAICYRMKKRALEADKRTTVKTEPTPEEVQNKLLSKEASFQNNHDDYDVMPYDGYEKICDVIQEDIAFNVASSAQSSGYGNLLPLNQRESSAYFKMYHQDRLDQGKNDLADSEDLGQAYYLTMHDSELEKVTPADPASHYLALTRDTGDASNAENRSSDYLKPC